MNGVNHDRLFSNLNIIIGVKTKGENLRNALNWYRVYNLCSNGVFYLKSTSFI